MRHVIAMSGDNVMCINLCSLGVHHSWLETMYNLFGTKWCDIFAGPLWSYIHVAQTNEHQTSSQERYVQLHFVYTTFSVISSKALVNVPALSEHTIHRGAEFNPGVHRRIKGDGTDVLKGLCQSGEWAGDVDLYDGKLQRQYSIFKKRVEKIQCIGLDNKSIAEIKCDLFQELDAIQIEFLKV